MRGCGGAAWASTPSVQGGTRRPGVRRSWLGAEGDEAPASAGEVRAAALEARGKVSSTTATTPPPAPPPPPRPLPGEGRGRPLAGGGEGAASAGRDGEREEGEREPIGSDKKRGRPIG